MRITTTYAAVGGTFSKSGKCGCDKHRTRRRRFEQTLNPCNKNPDGTVKDPTDIMRDVRKQAADWGKEPITCRECDR